LSLDLSFNPGITPLTVQLLVSTCRSLSNIHDVNMGLLRFGPRPPRPTNTTCFSIAVNKSVALLRHHPTVFSVRFPPCMHSGACFEPTPRAFSSDSVYFFEPSASRKREGSNEIEKPAKKRLLSVL
jgi:hypothetical protein